VVLETLTVGLYETNCYIYASMPGGEAFILDPGEDVQAILGKVRQFELTVAKILLTHGHVDHTGALKDLKTATGAAIGIHSEDVGLLQDSVLAAMLGISNPRPPSPDFLLEDGQQVNVSGLTLTVMHTPGHTGGSVSLLGDGLVFTGDTLFQQGIGRTDLPGGSYTDLMNSIRTRLLTLPDETRVFPGHGPATTIGGEKRFNPWA
jgi:hydroxyacylglutathione hydrolase